MKLPYAPPEIDEATQELAKALVSVIIDAGVTYKKAEDALGAAQRILASETMPSRCVSA